MSVISPPRQPFAELGASRLQSLSSAKNRQNAITELMSTAGKGKTNVLDSKITLSSPAKRPYSTSIFEEEDEDEDSENVDPITSPSIKRSKNVEGLSVAKTEPLFNFNVVNNQSSPLKSRTTPTSFGFPSAPSPASTGRLPKPKRVGLLSSKKRSSLSPFKRVDPPPFCSNKNRSAGLPFSIDAAISGTLSKSTPTPKASDVPVLQEAMPKGWFFDIHEDTPDEEAAIIMEHSTCTLDISSDDEAGPSQGKDERGKENIPPPEWSRSSATPAVGVTPAKPRLSAHADAMVDEGEDRAPLGSLPAEDFYAKGLDKDSVEVIPEHRVHEDDPQTPVVDEDDAAEVEPLDKENIRDTTPNVASPSRLAGTIDAVLSSSNPDFVIAEDPVDTGIQA